MQIRVGRQPWAHLCNMIDANGNMPRKLFSFNTRAKVASVYKENDKGCVYLERKTFDVVACEDIITDKYRLILPSIVSRITCVFSYYWKHFWTDIKEAVFCKI